MIDRKLHTPEGVKDYLPYEYEFKKEIERNIEIVFHRYGFCPVKSPAFEYMEVFEGKGSIDSKQMYKFLDRDGSILALRSDMTPAIARIAATAYEEKDIPLRFYYFDNAFRYNENYQGKLREFTQAGIELIGINSYEADAEVIAVAIRSLLISGLENFRIDIGQVQFLNGILEETGLNKKICSKIQNYIILKDYVAVENTVKNLDLSEEIKAFFSQLPLLIGGAEILEKAKEFTSNDKSLKALNNLREIYKILTEYGLNEYISFDLSVTGHLDYYTGLIFRGYTYGTGFSVIDGGRYDKLVSNYGANYPAIGFAIKINDLINALENQNISVPTDWADTLLVYNNDSRKTALSTADELRSQGLSIENSLIGNNIDRNIEYARMKNMGGIIYFLSDEKVKLIDLQNNIENELNISELLNSIK